MGDAQQAAETFIVFTVARTAYAIRSRDVQHMEMVEEVTRVPNAPAYVDGVVFSRGQVLPAVSLRARFGFERIPYDLRTRLLVVQTGGRSLGLIADDAREFMQIPAAAIHPAQESIAGVNGQYVEGIASFNDRLVVVLNLEQLLEFPGALIPS